MTSIMYNHKEPWKKYPVSRHYNIEYQTKRMINGTISLTLLSRMKLPTFIKRTSPFSSSGFVGGCFSFSFKSNRTVEKPNQTLQSVASDLGLYYMSMSHKKNASLIWVKYLCLYVTHISCIVSSSNWIMIRYRAV